ncbi:MAG TPA: dynamin family protein [Minicystis sp.]|nr:dynamin family protein [Minicystis sp.]
MLESFHQRRDDVVAALKALSGLAEKVGAKSLGAHLDADLVKKLEADRFHLVVVGEFNHGKTTFVNALLGANVLPVGVTPTTAVIHHLEYAQEPRAEVVRASGAHAPLPFAEVRKFAVGGESVPHDGAVDDVKYLEVGYPADLLKERVVLVDTPGVNDLSLQRADITYSYIPRSDAVLFLLDAGQPLKESERVFLQEKLLGQSRDKIIFVVTKRDIWDAAEQHEALAYIRTELAKLVKTPVLFAVSAEKHLEGDPSNSGIGELLLHLTKFLADERGRILLDNALGEGIEAGKLLGKGVDARRRAAAMTVDELERRIALLEKDLAGQSRTIEQRRAGIREEVSAIKAWVQRDLEHFRDDVIKQLPTVIEQASTDELKSYLGAFLERTFTEWAQAETKEIGAALEALAEKTIALVREDANDVAKRLGDALGGDVKAPNVEVDTFGYDVGVVGLLTVGAGVLFTTPLLGGMLLVAAPVLAVYVRGKVEVETKKRANEMAPLAIREAASKIGPKLDEMIDQFAARLDAWVVTAGEELHREVIEVLSTARRERAAQQQSTEGAVKACDEQASELEAVSARLGALRSALWSPSNGESTAPPERAGAPNAPGGTA